MADPNRPRGDYGGGRGGFGGPDRGRGGFGGPDRGRGGFRGDFEGARGGRFEPRGGGGSGYGDRQARDIRTGTPLYTTEPNKSNYSVANLSQASYGWSVGEVEVTTNTYKPPVRAAQGTIHKRMLGIFTNHVETRITFPKRIYHYEILVKHAEKDVTKKKAQVTLEKPKKAGSGGEGAEKGGEIRRNLWRKIVIAAIKKIKERHARQNHGEIIEIATDCSKAMYTITEVVGTEEVYTVQSNELSDDDSYECNNTFLVNVNQTKATIDTAGLTDAINDMFEKSISNLPEIEQVYNIVLKTIPMFRFIPVGRASFFSAPQGDGFDIGGGLVNWTGFSSIYTFGFKPFINIDIANTAFIRGADVLVVLDSLFKGDGDRKVRADDVRTWTSSHVAKSNELLKTYGITYDRKQGPISRRVNEVVKTSPSQYTFDVDGKKTNIEEYFVGLGVTLKHKHGPCLVLGNKSAVPAEICRVNKGQSYNKKLHDFQTANMIKDTAKPPAERKQRIMDAIEKCDLKADGVLRAFGVELKKNITLNSLNVRQLPAPQICYGANAQQRIDPVDGVWNCWDYKFQFIVPAKLANWRVLVLEERDGGRDDSAIKKFTETLQRLGKQGGMEIAAPGGVSSIQADVPGLEQKLKDFFKKCKDTGLKFLLVVIPKKGAQCYGVIKKLAELKKYDIGLLTQCVTASNVSKCQSATVGNLLFKINAKLDGINHMVTLPLGHEVALKQIDFMFAPTMVIGADVTHPTANTLSQAPSVAAVTASIDLRGQKYTMTPQVQIRPDKSAAEVIENFGQIVLPMIKAFRRQTQMIPRKLVIYRDGVGDGQYAEVLIKELSSLRAACHQLKDEAGEKYEPKITFLTVQKRHKCRFFPQDPNTGIGRSRNVQPGAVVDQDIVHPSEMDFYLLSHQGIQGTSRPTRYHLLWDDSDFSPDQIQNLTYYLCHAYNRCTRAVSIPAPTYYAHLAAYRVRSQMEALGSNEYTDLKSLNEAIGRDENLARHSPMHYI